MAILEHCQAVFLFWLVWKCLDLCWLHGKVDFRIEKLKLWVIAAFKRDTQPAMRICEESLEEAA